MVRIVCVVDAEFRLSDQPDRSFFERILGIKQTATGAEFGQHGCEFIIDLIKRLRTFEDAGKLRWANCLTTVVWGDASPSGGAAPSTTSALLCSGDTRHT